MTTATQSIQLYVVAGDGYRHCYATAAGRLLLIGGIDLATASVYPGDQMHANADLRALDNFLGNDGWDYDRALACARELLARVPAEAIRVQSVSEIV